MGLAWSLGGAAMAAEPVRFAVPAQPLPQAVLAFGAQAGISIGSGSARDCGRSRPLRGSFEVEAGLTRLLAGTGCSWRRIDDRAYVIVPARGVSQEPRAVAPGATPPVAEPTPSRLSEIVVTATKEDAALARAPYALTALDGRAFDAATTRDTADLATRMSGLTITNLGPGRNKVFIRGLSDGPVSGQTQATVGLYLDGTRLTYDVPDPDLRLIDIDRVELLRGPQGTLYGAGSIGGILQIVTRAPDLTDYTAEVFAGGVLTEGSGTSRSADLVFNAPILRDRLALRGVVYSEVIAGAIDDPPMGLDSTGDTAREGGRLNLLWKIDRNWDLRLGYVAQTLNSNDSQYGFTELGGDRRALSVREPSRNDFDGGSATLSGDLGWARLKIDSAVQSHDLARRYDATLAAADFGGAGPTAYDESDSIEAWVNEATLSSRPDRRLRWLAGIFAASSVHDRHGLMATVTPGASLYETVRQDRTREVAVYGQVSWALTDRLRITAGGRFFGLDVETRASASQGDTPSDALDADRQDSGFAPKFVAEYTLRDNVLLYLQASEGYRPGGFNAGAVLGRPYGEEDGPQPHRRFRSDELVNYEAGARVHMLDDALALRLALFRIDWRSIQSDRIGTDGLPFTGNIGNAENLGLEAEAAWIGGPWRLDANFTFQDPDLDAPDPGFPLPAERDLSGISNFTANLALRRSFTVASWPAWVSGSLGHLSPSDLTFSSTQSSAMGDYWTSNLAMGMEGPTWTLSARIDNPLGQRGDTFAYGNPFLVGRVDVTTPQRPPSLAIQISRRF